MRAQPITIEECDKQIAGYLHTLKTTCGQRGICWESIDYWLDERLELMNGSTPIVTKRRRRKVGTIAD
jgi:hypothetical protein